MDNKAMFKIGYGLYVLTANSGGKDNGCVVNSFMQITQNPLKVALCVNKQNLTHDMILESGRFNVSTLANNAPFELFTRFGFASGRATDKFAGFNGCARASNGLMYITEFANSYIACEIETRADMGTHTLITARVTDACVLSDAPSVTYAEYHARIKPAPAKKQKGFRCLICGYVYEGDELPSDFICPICKHGAADFEPITLEKPQTDAKSPAPPGA